MKILGNAFVVTGGASGLGNAVCSELLKLGASCVGLMDVSKKEGPRAAQELGKKAVFLHADVSSEEQVSHAVDSFVGRTGGIHGLVQCAAVPSPVKILSSKDILPTFRRTLDINLVGTFIVLRKVAQQMVKQATVENGERGVIINTSSIAAHCGQFGQAAYSASKGGVNALTFPAARELGKFGIRVNTVLPGLFKTPIWDAIPEKTVKKIEEMIITAVPFPKRAGHPSEFASFVCEMIRNGYINASIFDFAAGMWLQ